MTRVLKGVHNGKRRDLNPTRFEVEGMGFRGLGFNVIGLKVGGSV